MEEFREMRRKGQALCRKECKEILKQSDGGYPYAVTVN